MRKIVNNIMVCLLLAGLSACNDWLDISPKTDMKAEDMFSSEAGFRDALIGVYSLMSTGDLYGRNLSWGYLDVLAQYYDSPLKSTGSQHSMKNAAEYKYTETGEEARILSVWKNSYSAIANVNQALNFIDRDLSVFSTPEVHDVYKGELLALRAMLHFDLLRLFAPSPVLNEHTGMNALSIPYVDTYTNVAQPQLTVKEVLDRVKEDLLAAGTLMQDKEDFDETDSSSPMYNRRYRMNYYAVTALLARVYLYAEQPAEALKQVRKVIGEAGAEERPAPYALSGRDPLDYTELIFTLDVQKLKDMSENFFSEETPTYLLSMSAEARSSIYAVEGLDTDTRNGWLRDINSAREYTLEKFRNKTFIPLFKISELYLIAAECAGGDEGLAYLNELRNYRGLSSLASAGNLSDAIFREYRREFIGEGQLFFFYKRKGIKAIGAEENIPVDEAVYNLPVPLSEIEFGNIKND